jgi:hypothetical protein
MAHYAKLGIDNVVTLVVFIDNIRCMDKDGNEWEEIGLSYLKEQHGHENWKKCSYNAVAGCYYDRENQIKTNQPGFRANYPGQGWYYNSEYDIFHPPRPVDINDILCNSWSLNPTTGYWEFPIPKPVQDEQEVKEIHSFYVWDEQLHQSDNTKGWILQHIDQGLVDPGSY